MWKKLTDCGKPLSIHSHLRENNGNHFKEYKITETEFDQYKLELISIDNLVPLKKMHVILSCYQLVQHGFEAEEE